MRDGELPYRDFPVEYPPGALPAFLAPTYFGNYQLTFARLMAICGMLCLGLTALARPARWGLPLLAVSPLLLGSIVLTRFDLWPMVFVTAALAAFVHDRHRLGWAALGAGFAIKLFPV